MKKAFSLFEIILVIVIIGIVASFAIPKYMDTRDSALASTIKRDIITTITSVQSYYLVNRKIEKISDVLTLNTNNWLIEDKKISFKEKEQNCVEIELKDTKLSVNIYKDSSNVCVLLDEMGMKSQDVDLI